jgi:hypothetical protein
LTSSCGADEPQTCRTRTAFWGPGGGPCLFRPCALSTPDHCRPAPPLANAHGRPVRPACFGFLVFCASLCRPSFQFSLVRRSQPKAFTSSSKPGSIPPWPWLHRPAVLCPLCFASPCSPPVSCLSFCFARFSSICIHCPARSLPAALRFCLPPHPAFSSQPSDELPFRPWFFSFS